MLRKLYSLVHQNGCKPEDPDSPMMQEILFKLHNDGRLRLEVERFRSGLDMVILLELAT